MPAYFEQGFMVRQPAWHGLGVVLDDYPGREEGMRLAGHDFEVVEHEIAVVHRFDDVPDPLYAAAKGWKALVKSTDGTLLNVSRESYGVVQNSVGWDIVDAIIGEGAKYETGLTLKGGAVCCVLAWLDEPVTIPGDDSPLLPFLNVSWSHDGSSAITARSTSVRVVCWNTQSLAEAEGRRLETDFTFRHSKKVMERIEDAKMAIHGLRTQHEEFVALAEELAKQPVTTQQREYFIQDLVPMPPVRAAVSDRVVKNVDEARAAIRALFDGPTIPEPHRFTAYGLHLAGVEYLDHLRGWRNQETYFGRAMLRREPAKAKLATIIREVVKA